jgi:hypothetical protein
MNVGTVFHELPHEHKPAKRIEHIAMSLHALLHVLLHR